MKFKSQSNLVLLLFYLCSLYSFSQYNNQFKTIQNELTTKTWDLSVNGILISKNTSFIARQFEYQNFELAMVEVPLLLKTQITNKLSLLSGTKLDFYKNQFGFTSEVGISTSTGFQYDYSNNTYIQGTFNYQLNNTNNVYDYNFGSNSSFLLRSGIKF